ncbi:hypothetical protein GUA87_16020 [Sneathiella sp. P13V-1]|uniref:flagellar biosynthetic protein FliO n=1 Tax=Sneathiella sp. P13V-1 TaxID=2697366 RepID=UPI00187BC344|nr:flagellar biosynthetic protein FliO [Sneathiella sp. P13V-1]MBE7638365.1 hypothetical protein [Sneathiella sp. P13V-1]
MDLINYSKYIIGLLFVLGLIGLLAYIVRRAGFIPSAERPRLSKKRLGISQMIALDAKRRLVLIRRDDKEHLVILGPNSETVIETDIQAIPASLEQVHEDEKGDTSEDSDAHTHEPRLPRLPVHHHNDEASQ